MIPRLTWCPNRTMSVYPREAAVSVGNWQSSPNGCTDTFDNHRISTFHLSSGVCPFRNHPQGQGSHRQCPFTTAPREYYRLGLYPLPSLSLYTQGHTPPTLSCATPVNCCLRPQGQRFPWPFQVSFSLAAQPQLGSLHSGWPHANQHFTHPLSCLLR